MTYEIEIGWLLGCVLVVWAFFWCCVRCAKSNKNEGSTGDKKMLLVKRDGTARVIDEQPSDGRDFFYDGTNYEAVAVALDGAVVWLELHEAKEGAKT